MTQISMKEGLKRWGTKISQAFSNELSQLHLQDTFRTINTKSLSKSDYDKFLESHLFLKQKRDQTIKGRMVAGGNKQRNHIDKTDATLPTTALESVLLTAKMDAKEGRDVVKVNIPNAFVTTRIENKDNIATIRLRGKLAELMVAMSSLFYMHVVTKELGVLTIATSLPFFASIFAVRRTYYRAAVGDVASVLSMWLRCLLPPETICPLIVWSRFCFRNR